MIVIGPAGFMSGPQIRSTAAKTSIKILRTCRQCRTRVIHTYSNDGRVVTCTNCGHNRPGRLRRNESASQAPE